MTRRATTLEYLNELFILDVGAGTLIWRERPRDHFKNAQAHSAWNTRYSGRVAGTCRSDGYIGVRIEKKSHMAHRIVFALHHGLDLSAVPDEIDHRDNDCTNNRPSNLRAAQHCENMANIGAHANNTSGFKGVSWEARYRHWEVRIRAGGKRYHLGYFKDPSEAHAAYIKAANELHGEFARAA